MAQEIIFEGKEELGACQRCGKSTKNNLPYCSTDCQYWPHLRGAKEWAKTIEIQE